MGVGHVPKEPFRPEGEDPVVQGRERRGTTGPRDLAAARRARGKWGEQLASRWYVRNGWRIIATNVRYGRGEIDVIAERGQIVAICEVKARRDNRFGEPGEAMTVAKRRAVRAAAFGWARENRVSASRLRFDVALIVGTSIEVLEDAF